MSGIISDGRGGMIRPPAACFIVSLIVDGIEAACLTSSCEKRGLKEVCVKTWWGCNLKERYQQREETACKYRVNICEKGNDQYKNLTLRLASLFPFPSSLVLH